MAGHLRFLFSAKLAGVNFLDDLTPPNMDTVCVTDGATTTCSDPWNYYKAYGFDLVLFVCVIGVMLVLLLKK